MFKNFTTITNVDKKWNYTKHAQIKAKYTEANGLLMLMLNAFESPGVKWEQWFQQTKPCKILHLYFLRLIRYVAHCVHSIYFRMMNSQFQIGEKSNKICYASFSVWAVHFYYNVNRYCQKDLIHTHGSNHFLSTVILRKLCEHGGYHYNKLMKWKENICIVDNNFSFLFAQKANANESQALQLVFYFDMPRTKENSIGMSVKD